MKSRTALPSSTVRAVSAWLYGVILAICLVAVLYLVSLLLRDVPVGDPAFVMVGLLQVLLIVQLVVGSIALARTDADVDGVTFISYLIGVALAPVIGAFWSLAERSRAGTAVLALAVVTVAALEVRLNQIWSAAGA